MFKIIKLDNVPYFSNYFDKLSSVHNHDTRLADDGHM